MDNSNVIIYGASWCAFCHAAKDYLDKLGVKYSYKDIDSDIELAKEAQTKSDQSAIPVIDVNGTIILGFDRPKIDAALKEIKLI